MSKTQRRQYWFLVAALSLTSLLDLVGVVLVGLVAVEVLGGSESAPTGSLGEVAASFVSFFGVAPLLVIGAGLFLIKSSAYGVILRALTKFLASAQSDVAFRSASTILTSPLVKVEKTVSQKYGYAVTQGAFQGITQVLSSFSIVVADGVLTVLITVVLLVSNPSVTMVAMGMLSVVLFASHRFFAGWSRRIGESIREGSIHVYQILEESLYAHREIAVLGRTDSLLRKLKESSLTIADAQGANIFVFQAPKVVYEIAMIVVAGVIVLWQVQIAPIDVVLGTLAFFLIAVSRLAPSLMRMNAQLAAIRGSSEQGRATLELAQEYTSLEDLEPVTVVDDSRCEWKYPGFTASVELARVSFRYPEGTNPVIDAASLSIPAGSHVAVVGPTGAGKSTLVDLILGLRQPDAGIITISGMSPREALTRYPGATAYVPQRTAIFAATVRENLCLGLTSQQVCDDELWRVLDQVNMRSVVAKLQGGLDAHLGEHGTRFSGGQRQRIGLARALLSRPRLLVLDEATSALDAATEEIVGRSLRELPEDCTILTIAHRPATIRAAEQFILVADGNVRDFDSLADLQKLYALS